MLTQKFKEASNCRYCIGLKSCSSFNKNGSEVQIPKFPFMIKLVPNIHVRGSIVAENKHY